MKTIIKRVPVMTIEKFADQHNLEMEVNERNEPEGSPSRYYAHFKHAEVKEGRILCGTYGDGATPKEAITNYAPQISLKLLVIDAYGDRREIQVPRLK